MPKTQIIAGLDVGTTKICALIGELTGSGVDVVGIGQHPSRGLRPVGGRCAGRLGLAGRGRRRNPIRTRGR